MARKIEKTITELFNQYKDYMQGITTRTPHSFFQVNKIEYDCAFRELIISIHLSSCIRIAELDFVFNREVKITASTLTYKNLLKKSFREFKAICKNDSVVNLFGNTPCFFFTENGENLKKLTPEAYDKLLREYGTKYKKTLWDIINTLEREIAKIKEEEKEATNGQ